jgi:hypothetical protein
LSRALPPPARGARHARANIHHPPEEDNDIPGYWAMFVFDPDGLRLEVAHWPDADKA